MTNKVTKYLISLLGSVALLLSSCAENSQQILLEDDFGTLSLTGLNIEINGFSSVSSRAIEVDYDKFIIEIYSDGQTVPVIEPITYSQALTMETVSLPVGVYHAVVKGGSGAQSAFDDPYYVGESEPFAIESKKITVVPVIECELLSLAVRVVIDDKLLEMIDNLNQTSVEAYNDVENSLTFGKDQFRYGNSTGADGYFLDNGNALITIFNTIIGDNEVTMQYNIPNARKGTLYIVTYSATGSGIKPNPGTGTPSAGFTIDVTVTQRDLSFTIDGEADSTIDPSEVVRPGDDDETDKLPNNPGNEDPGHEDNSIRFESSTLSLDDMNQASEFGENLKPAVLEIYADNGIANLYVTINSDAVLTPEVLSEVNLTTNFDLANPATEKMREIFISLGFVTEDGVKGKTQVDFDITTFMPLIPALGTGESDFIIEVVDQKGNRKSVTLRVWSVKE